MWDVKETFCPVRERVDSPLPWSLDDLCENVFCNFQRVVILRCLNSKNKWYGLCSTEYVVRKVSDNFASHVGSNRNSILPESIKSNDKSFGRNSGGLTTSATYFRPSCKRIVCSVTELQVSSSKVASVVIFWHCNWVVHHKMVQ